MNPRLLALAPALLLLAVFAGRFSSTHPFIILSAILCLTIAIATLQNPVNGLFIFMFAMLLSPEISLANVPGRPVTVRVDDFMLIALFIAWLAAIARDKEWQGFIKTPLDPYLTALVTVYAVGTGIGIVAGQVNSVKALFYTLKYVEYFILYWIVVNTVTSIADIRRLLWAGGITAAVVTAYAYYLIAAGELVFAPFDTGGGEPASLGGYYLLVFAVAVSWALHAHRRTLLLTFAATVTLLPPFIKTLSRASYLAFVPLLLTVLLLTQRRRIPFAGLLLTGAVLFPLLAPGLFADMSQRVMTTFTGGHAAYMSKYAIGQGRTRITDQSALERLATWRHILYERFPRDLRTILVGSGITGLGFVEGQFFLLLGENGLLGTALFYIIMLILLRTGYRVYRASTHPLDQGLSLGLVAGTVGLLFQSLTTNTFIIVRIMEPYWFLAGIVVALPAARAHTAAQEGMVRA